MVLCRVLLSKVFKWCRQRQEISFSFRAALCTCQLPGLGTQYPGSWSQEAQPCCADFCALQQRKRKSNLEHFFSSFFRCCCAPATAPQFGEFCTLWHNRGTSFPWPAFHFPFSDNFNNATSSRNCGHFNV